MPKTIKLLAAVSRPEFLPANLASLVIAISWAVDPKLGLTWELATAAFLSFAIITFVSAIGAQLNSLSDYELDTTDETKKKFVRAMDGLGRDRLKRIIVVEFLLSLPFAAMLFLLQGKLALLIIWAAGNFLAYAYSAPPLRLKSRSWLALVALLLVLCFLPILFVYWSVTSELNPLFLLFLVGQAMTVYGVIIPTEIRDYFVDKSMGVETMTVRLGLVRASLLAMVLLSLGGILSGSAFFLGLALRNQTFLGVFLIAMAIADYAVLKKFRKLYFLSRKHAASKGLKSTARDVVELAASNPKWITMVSQAIVLMSIVFLLGKFLL